MVLQLHMSTKKSNKLIDNSVTYLVGDMGRWNNGKKAEEHDRVKHTVSDGENT